MLNFACTHSRWYQADTKYMYYTGICISSCTPVADGWSELTLQHGQMCEKFTHLAMLSSLLIRLKDFGAHCMNTWILYTIQKNNTGPYRHAGMPVCYWTRAPLDCQRQNNQPTPCRLLLNVWGPIQNVWGLIHFVCSSQYVHGARSTVLYCTVLYCTTRI